MHEVEHITACSPCFVEYQAIRAAYKREQTTKTTALVAALALTVFSGVVLVSRHGAIVPARPPQGVEVATEQTRKAVIDLRAYERLRGDGPEPRPRPAPLTLHRVSFDITIHLPVGSEEGKYLFELIDASGIRRLETSGDAAVRNYIMSAHAPFDLRKLSPGPFTLTVRRADQLEPASYPVEVR
jgi:hypothetical protein